MEKIAVLFTVEIFLALARNESLPPRKRPCLCHHDGAWTIDCSAQQRYIVPLQPCLRAVDPRSVRSFDFSSNYIKRVPFNYFRNYTNLGVLYVYGGFMHVYMFVLIIPFCRALKDNLVSNLCFLPPSLVSFEFSKRKTERQSCSVTSFTGIFDTLTHLDSV
jgi:hypothetical protein